MNDTAPPDPTRHRSRPTRTRSSRSAAPSSPRCAPTARPFRTTSAASTSPATLQARYGDLDREALAQANVEVVLAGRMMLKRVMGKASFATIQDSTGRIQLYVANDDTGEEVHEAFKHWDLGDIVAARGVLFKTQKGELSVRCRELRLLAKSLRPLPDKFHGLEDREQRYRQRYVDLMMNEETRAAFVTRSRAIAAMRQFMVDEGFLEVETPMLQVIPGGAAAKPFVTHHNALDIDMYLRIAPELFLKRLVVGGFDRVFEINRNFRNEGLSPRHNPEFTMMEFYAAYHEYRWLMDFTERLLRHVAIAALRHRGAAVPGPARSTCRKPFARLTTVQAIRQHAPQYTEAQLADRDYLHRELRAMGSTHARGGRPRRAAARAVRGNGGVEADRADLHRRLPGRGLAAGARVGQPARTSPSASSSSSPAARPPTASRSSTTPRTRPRASTSRRKRQGRRRRGGDVLRRRLRPRARIRHAAGRRLRRRRRPLHHAADQRAEHPRRHPVPASATGSLTRDDWRTSAAAR